MHPHIWYKRDFDEPGDLFVPAALKQRHARQLKSLRPHKGMDRRTLRARLHEESWRAALPESLPDTVLLELARDFRRVEAYVCDAKAEDCLSSMASATLVVTSVLLRTEDSNAGHVKRGVSQDGLMRAMQVYQWGLEREIVSRIVGIQASIESNAFVEHLERCASD
jgi:hypothetical protein